MRDDELMRDNESTRNSRPSMRDAESTMNSELPMRDYDLTTNSGSSTRDDEDHNMLLTSSMVG
jgi:hypothetical protein